MEELQACLARVEELRRRVTALAAGDPKLQTGEIETLLAELEQLLAKIPQTASEEKGR